MDPQFENNYHIQIPWVIYIRDKLLVDLRTRFCSLFVVMYFDPQDLSPQGRAFQLNASCMVDNAI